MKPIEFEDQNQIFAKEQSEYQNLPALHLDTEEGQVISCWQLSWRERFRLLFTGKLWMMVMTFNQGLPPVYLTTDPSECYEKKE